MERLLKKFFLKFDLEKNKYKKMLDIFLAHALILLLFGIALGFLWALRRNGYWSRHHLPHIRGIPFCGNLLDLVLARKSPVDLYRDIYEDSAFVDEPVVGIEFFHQPALMVRDPQLAKQMLIKDFDSFSDRLLKCVNGFSSKHSTK